MTAHSAYDYFMIINHTQVYVIDSADRRRMEETGIELQQLMDEVRVDAT